MNANIDKIINEVVGTYVSERKSINNLSLNLAKKIIEKVENKADEMGVKAVVAVADNSGKTIAVECMDDSYIASFDIAVNKAFTSVALKMSTKALSSLAQPGESLYGIQFTNSGKIVIFGGGEPLAIDNKIIGAVGVSGGTEEQDTQLAAYAKEIFNKII